MIPQNTNKQRDNIWRKVIWRQNACHKDVSIFVGLKCFIIHILNKTQEYIIHDQVKLTFLYLNFKATEK